MLGEYIIAILTSNGFKYAAATAVTLWRVCRNVIKKGAAFFLILVIAMIFAHWYFKIPYSTIFGEVNYLFRVGIGLIQKCWSLLVEFFQAVSANMRKI